MKLMPAGGDSAPDKGAKFVIPQKKNIEGITTGLIKAASNESLASSGDTVYFTIDSDKSLAKVCIDLDRAFIRHEFDVLAVHDLKEELNGKGIEFFSNCITYEVTNHKLAKRFLDGNPQMAAIFPCKIIVYETPEGKRRLSTLHPVKLVELSGSRQLTVIAKDIEEVIKTIMNDASGSK